MRIQKSRMRCVGIFLAVVICFFAVQQSYSVQNMYDITQAEPDHLAVHTMERQQGSFLDILGRSELTQSEQAASDRQCTDHAAECRTQRHFVGRTCKRICRECYPDLSGASCRIENIFVRSHAWIMAYIHWQDGEKASDSLK